MTRSRRAWTHLARSSASGANASSNNAWPAWRNSRDTAGRPAFPPGVVIAVKALACELPWEHGLPLSRLSTGEICRAAVARGLVAGYASR